jgi:hypothetical protein
VNEKNDVNFYVFSGLGMNGYSVTDY